MTTDIDVSIAPLVPQQAGDQLIAVRDGAIVRAIVSSQSILALVARTGNYGDLMGLPDLSPSALGAATAAQGLLAETAVQPAGLATVATSGNYGDLQGSPDLSLTALGAATAAQGLLAETAVQPAAIATFETTTQLDARDAANRDRANHEGTQPASTISDFASVAAAAAPVQSVAGRGGAVVLAAVDVGLGAVDNTSDLAKPISAATQTALDLKASAANLAEVATTGQYSALLGIPSTFTPSIHSQPWSTITSTPTTLAGYGITDAATAAQGAKADTAVQPSTLAAAVARLGFNYVGNIEPVSPVNGFRWLEIVDGLQVGQWEWISSFSEWVGLTTYELSSGASIGTAAGGNVPGYYTPKKRLIISRTMTAIYFSGAAFSSTAFHTFVTQIANEPVNGNISIGPNAILNSNAGIQEKVSINLVRTFSIVSVFRAVTGAPGNSRSVVSLELRDCRS